MSTIFLTLRMPFRMQKIENIIKITSGTKILGFRDVDNQRGALGGWVFWGVFSHVAYGIRSPTRDVTHPCMTREVPIVTVLKDNYSIHLYGCLNSTWIFLIPPATKNSLLHKATNSISSDWSEILSSVDKDYFYPKQVSFLLHVASVFQD